MGGRREVQSRATGFDRNYKKRYVISFLKLLHETLALCNSHTTVQHQTRLAKLRRKEFRQRFAHGLKLREYQHLLLTLTDRFADAA